MLIPLKVDVYQPRWPYVNVAIMAVTIIVSLIGFADTDTFCYLAGIRVRSSGFFEQQVSISLTTENLPLPVLAVTASLLHIGWIHLIGNMLFLWIFGNAMNYKFGQLGYLAFYITAAMLSVLAHYAFDGTPGVGASGAIYGVMGAFLIFFPRNDITVLWIIWFRPGLSRLSSGWIIAFWVAWDTLFLVLGASTGTAVWAHIGGFAVGFAIATTCALTGWVKPTQDEQTLLQVLKSRNA